MADKLASKNLDAGLVVAPVWPPTGGGSAMGTLEERQRFVDQVRKACRISRTLREIRIRPSGVVRVDSATDPGTWAGDPDASKKIASTFRECCRIAEDHGERLAAEGEVCWGGMHSWWRMVIAVSAGDVSARISGFMSRRKELRWGAAQRVAKGG